MTNFWEDFFRDMMNNSTNPYSAYNTSHYSNHYIPRNQKQGGIGRLAKTLKEIKELMEALLNNQLETSHIVEEKLAIDDNKFELNLIVEKEIAGETRRFNISVEEVFEKDSDDEEESDEDKTNYFTE